MLEIFSRVPYHHEVFLASIAIDYHLRIELQRWLSCRSVSGAILSYLEGIPRLEMGFQHLSCVFCSSKTFSYSDITPLKLPYSI